MRILSAYRSLLVLGLLSAYPALAAETFVIEAQKVPDEKPVFATIESVNVAPARARIGGTVATLTVKQGDRVSRGQVIASIGDEKLALQVGALDAQIAGLEAEVAQAQVDLNLAENLLAGGTIARIRVDEARTAFAVATNSLRARTAERGVLVQQLKEGSVLAPVSGRVLQVPLTPGAVVLAGEEIAVIAQQDYVLRLRIPERHARALAVGDTIRLAGEGEDTTNSERFGTIRLIYPEVQDGRVVADALLAGVGDYFVGERVPVFLQSAERTAFVVPRSYVFTRYGIDYVRLQQGSGAVDVPVQLGRMVFGGNSHQTVEILSGVRAGDRLVSP